MKIVTFIPARGGSKGIPRKNVLPFLGFPLINYSIEYAKTCDLVDGIYVSTNDKEIAEISSSSGAQVINRPNDISTDTATTESAIHHFLNVIDDKPEIIILLQATSPLRPAGSLADAINTFIQGEFDSLLSLTPTHQFFWEVDGNIALPKYDFKNRPRRQDFRPSDIPYDENGSLYIFTRKHFEKTGNRLGGRIGYITFAEKYGYQIDSMDDFNHLESLASNNREE